MRGLGVGIMVVGIAVGLIAGQWLAGIVIVALGGILCAVAGGAPAEAGQGKEPARGSKAMDMSKLSTIPMFG